MKEPNTTCAQCGEPLYRDTYQMRRSPRHFCTQACKGRWRTENEIGPLSGNWRGGPAETTCRRCGKAITLRQHDFRGHGHHYCSWECRDQDHQDHRVTVSCASCGKQLVRTKYRVEHSENQFCNRKCMGAYQSEHLTGPDSPIWSRVELECSGCGAPVVRFPRDLRRHKDAYCSDECKNAAHSQKMSHDGNPAWSGGSIAYYGPNWKAQRRKARRRDGYTCQDCGVSEEEFGRQLDVHHITPFRFYGIDRYKEANRLANLVSLCQSCHRHLEWQTKS